MCMTFMMALKLTKCCYEQGSVASKAHHMKYRRDIYKTFYLQNPPTFVFSPLLVPFLAD